MAQLLPWLASPGARTAGNTPVSSGFAWFYEIGGGTTQAIVYADEDAVEIMTQPVRLDAGGRATVYTIDPVRVVIQDATTADVSDLDQANVIRAEAVQVDNQWFTDGYLDGVLSSLGESFGGTNGMYQESGGAVPRTIHEKFAELSVSVKDFGAKGDGLAMDTTAIQAAINRVGFLGGGTVYFPPGTYRVDQVLTNSISGVSLRGANAKLLNESTINSVIAISGASRFVIEGLYIDATAPSTGSAISITNATSVSIQNVRVEKHFRGINFNTVSIAVVDTAFIVAPDTVGARGVLATDSSVASIISTYIYGGVGGQCVEYAGSSAACTVVGTRFELGGVLFAASLTGRGFHFVGNTFPASATEPFGFAGATMPAGFYQRGNGIDGYTEVLLNGGFYTPNLKYGWTFRVNATATGLAYTINVPSPPPAATDYGVYIDIVFANNTGALITAWGLAAGYHLAGGTAPSAVIGEQTSIRFWWDPVVSVWREQSRAVTT